MNGTAGSALAPKALREAIVVELTARHGVDAAEITDERPLAELGLSSRDAVTLTARLGELTGARLPATLLWETPTLGALLLRLTDDTRAPNAVTPTPAARPQGFPIDAGTEVAVVGIGCRLPGGVRSARDFWQLLTEGGDAVATVPEGRWEPFIATGAPLPEDIARHGAYLGPIEEIAGFDAEFFGIGSEEARTMDPQQRMLLEVAREALDHAAVPARSLAGSRTGVFVGISGNEYAHLTTSTPEAVNAWTTPGASLGVSAGRLSYVLDLRGPAVAVDTACSSSLVAVHNAVRSLASGECDAALAAGVNLLLSPAVTLGLQRAGALSPGGRCKAFDASADGISRGEGCAVVVLKRLADAERDGDRVLAVIDGSAVNCDGRSNGLTAPNLQAQQELLAQAHSSPALVDYVEAHGTGTPLGDPIEAGALGAALGHGSGRGTDQPLLIGSVKTNLGHLEAAAGITGLIKTVLALHHGEIPGQLHFTGPGPHSDPAALGLRVVTAAEPWPRYSGSARAGVSAFGFSGTNAHVTLREHRPAARTRPARSPERPAVVLLDAATEDRLRESAGELAEWLGTRAARAVRPDDLGRTSAGRTGRGSHRAAVVARESESLRAALGRYAAGEADPHLVTGTARSTGPGPVWLFSGYGSQWPGMARQLLAVEPAFAAAVDELEEILVRETGVSLRAGLEPHAELTTTAQVMPVLFGLQLALARLWQSYGMQPAAVIGHSLGEVAAAVVAGSLDVVDGARVVGLRSKLLTRCTAGAMAVVDRPGKAIESLAADFPSLLVAVHASPGQSVVTGTAEDVRALAERITEEGGFARLLPVTVAGHSPEVDTLLPELRAGLQDLTMHQATVRRYSTVAQDPRATVTDDADHWVANLREPVRLTQAVRAAAEDGHRVFLEVSPHPTQLHPVAETLRDAGVEHPLVLGTLHRDGEDPTVFRTNLATLLTGGVELPAAREVLHPQGRIVDIPSASWSHRVFWPGYVDDTPGGPAPATADTSTMGRLRACVSMVMGYGPERLDADVPLIEMGLDSLSAVRISTVVREEFGTTFPATTLLRQGTLGAVARLLDQEAEGAAESMYASTDTAPAPRRMTAGSTEGAVRGTPGRLRTFPSSGPGAPLFLCHAAGGLADVYGPLAERLGGVRPVLGFDRYDSPGDGVESVTSRAAEFALRVREAAPDGPWLLGGWSYGGVVAQEAARQLSEVGEVAGLVLFDSVLPLPSPEELTPLEEAHRRFAGFSAYVEQVYGAPLPLPYEELAPLDDAGQVGLVLKLLSDAVDLPAPVLEHQRTSYLDLRSGERHRPAAYAGPTVLYRASEPAPHTVRDARYERADRCLGWDAHCTDLTVRDLPGHHLALLDPPVVHTLAALLTEDLEGS